MDKCFVMQPFDGGIFDKRHEDTFAHTIRDAGLEPSHGNISMNKLIQVVGIFMVTVGAWFVGYEVVNKYKGDSHIAITPCGVPGKVHKLGKFEYWEKIKNRYMVIGLLFITAGNILQVIAVFN